ncbi:MAG: T9SS type A sorting domain-containing protein, partial [Ignavibacteria bacterium]|nr:T9SS type A sorting domain-containing protein [Ignavibacteria bacterium]
NTSQQEIKNLYLGYFMDWNLSDNYFNDSTTYDELDNFAYVLNKDNIVAGATLLSQQKIGYTGINSTWRVGEIILEDGFQDEEKWYSISNGIIKDKVYGDVSFVISGGPVNLFSGKKEIFAFAIAPASSKEELRQILKQSRQKYLSIPDNIDDTNPQIPGDYLLQQNYPNPFNPETTISYQLPKAEYVTLKVYDVLGREVATLVNEFKQAGVYHSSFITLPASPTARQGGRSSFATGVYFYRLQAGSFVQAKKMLLLK